MIAERYIKAIAAFLVTLVVLFGGDEVSKDVDVDTIATILSSLLVAIGVAAAPANRG